ncbi:hypothetical protein GKR41_00692 [Candidatus Vallotia lariciata]|nr:hypothetical protein GKR41_00692 [Candidatus Vallotia lariciata]
MHYINAYLSANCTLIRDTKQAGKPDSVRATEPGTRDSHSSRLDITDELKLPTRRLERVHPCALLQTHACLLGIAPGGGYTAEMRCRNRGALLPHHFILT